MFYRSNKLTEVIEIVLEIWLT